MKRAGLKRLDQVANAEKTGLGCNYIVAGTTTSYKDSKMVDAEDTRI